MDLVSTSLLALVSPVVEVSLVKSVLGTDYYLAAGICPLYLLALFKDVIWRSAERLS
jgi:hypothetical protein